MKMKKCFFLWILAAICAATPLFAADVLKTENTLIAPAVKTEKTNSPKGAADSVPPIDDIYADLETFANALTIIDAHYVDDKKPRDLVYGALKGMLQSLDPYSQFLDPEGYENIKVETEGKFGGIGVEITFREGILTVISPVDGTPAAEAGVAPGDRIVKIDEISTRDMQLDDAVKKLRGKPGATVKLTVMREGEGSLLEFKMKRAIINVRSIKEARVLGDGVGYIRISEFQQNTPRDMAKALKELEREKIRGLIIDLRNNPGGLLSASVDVAEMFVPRGELVVYTKGRTAEQETSFVSSGVKAARPYPIVVLVNQGSASASEILAGSLKDHKLAILMGTKTFGKGSVQTVIPMRDGSAIRLTTAKYFTPSGQVIHGHGIQPNIEVPFEKIESQSSDEKKPKEKVSEIFDRVENATTPNGKKKSGETPSQSKGKTPMDSQILRAMDLIGALNIYGLDFDYSKGSGDVEETN